MKHRPGFALRWPVIPSGAVYIGRSMPRYGLTASRWRNPVSLPRNASLAARQANIAADRVALLADPARMALLTELRGCDLLCWCAPLPCHGDVLLLLANPEQYHDEWHRN